MSREKLSGTEKKIYFNAMDTCEKEQSTKYMNKA